MDHACGFNQVGVQLLDGNFSFLSPGQSLLDYLNNGTIDESFIQSLAYSACESFLYLAWNFTIQVPSYVFHLNSFTETFGMDTQGQQLEQNFSQLGSTFSPDTGAFQDAAQYEPTTGHDEPFQDTNSFAPRHGSPPPQADDANYSLPQTEEDTCPQGEDGDEDTASPSGTSNMARARTSTSGVTPLSDQVIKSAGPRG